MSGVDTRNLSRDSLLLTADVRPEGSDVFARIKVRNLSAGGMMADGDVAVDHGAKISVELRNIGRVNGVVAWVEDRRFGIAFSEEIDPKLVREPVGSAEPISAPRFVRPAGIHPQSQRPRAKGLRKI